MRRLAFTFLFLASTAQASPLYKNRFDVSALRRPAHIMRVRELNLHIRRDDRSGQISLASFIGTIVEMRHMLNQDMGPHVIQWHCEHQMFTIYNKKIDEVAVIKPNGLPRLHSALAWKANKLLHASVEIILNTFDYQ